MACMCGDTHCGSCGPAQGNSKCPICGAWADDGCVHVDEETGELKPEFEAEAKRINDEIDDGMYQDYLEEKENRYE